MNDDIKKVIKENGEPNKESDLIFDERNNIEFQDDQKQEINENFENNEASNFDEISEFEKESKYKENDIFEPVVEKISETNLSDTDEIAKSVINDESSNEESKDKVDTVEQEEISLSDNDEENLLDNEEETLTEKKEETVEDTVKPEENVKDKEEKETIFKHSVLEGKKVENKEIKEKPKKKSFKEFWNNLGKPVKILAIVSIVLIVFAGALGITHAIITKDIVFIHSEEDLFKALEKGKGGILYIKEDVTISKDVTFTKPYDINLHGNTLTVNGIITYNLNNEENTVVISTLKKKSDIKLGAINAQKFEFRGEKSTLQIYSDINAEISIKSAKTVNYYSSASNIKLEDLVKTFNLYGRAQTIVGGNKVVLYNSSIVDSVSNASKVIIEPNAKVNNLNNISSPIFVEKLEAPKNIMVDTSRAIEKILVFTFNKVVNANSYVIKIDNDTIVPVIRPSGENAGTIAEDGDKITVTYYAEQLVPNDYEVSIYAIASEENKEMYLDSDKTSSKFTVSIELPEPIIDNIDKENGKIIISFNQYVSSYIIKINNQSLTVSDFSKDENNKVSIDIKDYISSVGSYSISVVAHSDHSYYSDSKPSYKSLVITKKLDAPVFNTVVVDEVNNAYTFSWQAVENAKFYKIVATIDGESTEYYTSLTNLTLVLDPQKANTINFNVVKNGYYLDSDVVPCAIDYIVPEIPEEPVVPEDNSED